MSWFRMDDKFHSHPKVFAAGNAAIGLWVRCGTWSADHGTEGYIPAHVARQFGTKSQATALVDSRLWAVVDDGYKMPDYLEFNPSNAEVEDKRKKRAEAGRKGGTAKANGVANATANAQQYGTPGDKQTPTPSRPDPSPTPSVLKSVVNTDSVATRPPDDDKGKIIERIITRCASLRTEQARPKNPTGYHAAVVADMLAKEADAIRTLLADKPFYATMPDKAASWYEATRTKAVA